MQVNRIPPSIVLTVIVGVCCATPQANATDYFAAPNGKTPAEGGDGSIGNPWDLKSALETDDLSISAGDRLWLRGGLYRPEYDSGFQLILADLIGDPNAPVIVSSYPGEWAVIDARGSGGYPIIDVFGHDTHYLNFELTSSHADRITSENGGQPSDIERGCGLQTNTYNPTTGLERVRASHSPTSSSRTHARGSCRKVARPDSSRTGTCAITTDGTRPGTARTATAFIRGTTSPVSSTSKRTSFSTSSARGFTPTSV